MIAASKKGHHPVNAMAELGGGAEARRKKRELSISVAEGTASDQNQAHGTESAFVMRRTSSPSMRSVVLQPNARSVKAINATAVASTAMLNAIAPSCDHTSICQRVKRATAGPRAADHGSRSARPLSNRANRL